MKKRRTAYVPRAGTSWKQGGETFMHKGTNGRCRDVLTEGDLELYAAACARTLTDDYRDWLNR